MTSSNNLPILASRRAVGLIKPVLGQPQAQGAGGIQWLPDPVDWLERYFYIPETNKPIRLAPYIKAALREALRCDEAGNFVYSLVVWSDIKKSGKSSIAAGVALWFAYRAAWSSIKIIANDLEQAESRVNYYMTRAIYLNPAMRRSIKIIRYKKELSNHTVIKAIPIDPKGEAGGNDDFILYSELWGWSGDKSKQMWTETTLSPTKYGQSIQWVESYAGFEGQSTILRQLYDQLTEPRLGGAKLVIHGDLETYTNAGARMFGLWNTRPRLPWQTADYYKQEQAKLDPSEFDRVHRNQWASAINRFIEPAAWAACQRDIPALAPGDPEPLVVAIDAAVSNDYFGIVGVSRTGDTVIERFAAVWKPGGKTRQIDFADPERYLRRLVRPVGELDPDDPKSLPGLGLNVLAFCYDPYQLVDMAQRLRRAGLGNFVKFDQTRERLEADSMMQKAIYRQKLWHNGHEALTEHVLNAYAKIDADGSRIRLVKGPDHSRKIDLAVCLTMAGYKIMYYNI